MLVVVVRRDTHDPGQIPHATEQAFTGPRLLVPGITAVVVVLLGAASGTLGVWLMLIAVGVMLLTGWWDDVVTWRQIHLVRGCKVSA